ncbi:MAG TPA: hypothetical protein VGS09_05860 [Actinomycetota bacterium]|nr:hypothetical protein [Actinomycetota bacterium]
MATRSIAETVANVLKLVLLAAVILFAVAIVQVIVWALKDRRHASPTERSSLRDHQISSGPRTGDYAQRTPE